MKGAFPVRLATSEHLASPRRRPRRGAAAIACVLIAAALLPGFGARASAAPPSAPSISDADQSGSQILVEMSQAWVQTGAPAVTPAITNYEYSTDNGASWRAFDPPISTPVYNTASAKVPRVGICRASGSGLPLAAGTYQVALRAVNADGVGAASASTPVAFAPFTFYEMNPCGGNWGGQDLRVLTGGTDFGQSTFNTFGIFRGGLQQVYLGFSGPGDYCFYFFAEATAVGCELPPLTVGTGVTRKDWNSVSPPVTSQTGETWTLEQTGSVTLNTRPYSLATTLEYTSPNAFVDVHHVLTTPDVSSLQRTTDDTVTSGSTAMTVTSGTGIRVGMCVAGTGIASGTVVKAISGTSVTLDRSATANVTGGTATFSACAKIYQSSDMYLDGSDFGPGDDTLIGGNRLVAQVTPSSQLNPGVVNGGVGGILEVTGYPFTSWAEALFQCVFGKSTSAAQSECADVPWGANYGGRGPTR